MSEEPSLLLCKSVTLVVHTNVGAGLASGGGFFHGVLPRVRQVCYCRNIKQDTH